MKEGTLYMGVLSDLVKRIWKHKNNIVKGFANKYHVHKLVYHEVFQRIEDTIKREKQPKRWNRSWKIELIEKQNPQWKELYSQLLS